MQLITCWAALHAAPSPRPDPMQVAWSYKLTPAQHPTPGPKLGAEQEVACAQGQEAMTCPMPQSQQWLKQPRMPWGVQLEQELQPPTWVLMELSLFANA